MSLDRPSTRSARATQVGGNRYKRFANDTEYGLSAAVFGRDIAPSVSRSASNPASAT